MRKNPHFALDDEAVVRRLIEENPWATLVSHASEGLVASHYPIMLDDSRPELAVLTHLGRPDEKVHELGERELLVIVQGPHGYVSPSWYGPGTHVPTWNFVVAHLSGVPELLEAEENLEVLERLVDHFERHVAAPHPLMGTPEDAEYAGRLSRGTVGLRLTPTRIVAKRKLSQNKSPEIVRSVMAELEGEGPYASAPLAREMRLLHGRT
jgi:transcriptional regulator